MRKYMGRFISAIVLVVGFIPAFVFAQAIKVIDALVVLDDTDKKVGTIVGGTPFLGGTPVVAIDVGGVTITIGVVRDRFLGNIGEGPYFESMTCSGTAYIPRQDVPQAVPTVRIAGPGNTVYVADPSSVGQTVNVNSAIDEPGSVLPGEGDCEPFVNMIGGLVPVVVSADLFTVFTPPFVVREDTGPTLAALQQEVDALESQVADLEGNLNDHRHGYRTGKGRGHNNTRARTGSAVFPAP